MGWCTGSGEANGDHCCYVGANEDGTQRVCPHLMDNAAIMAWIDAQPWGNNKKNAARAFAQNIVWSCKIGIQTLADGNASLRSNRTLYENAFLANAEYQAFPAPFWRELETTLGLVAGSMDCVKWQGETTPTGGRTCCYRRTTAEADADAAARGISSVAVTIRKAGGRPD